MSKFDPSLYCHKASSERLLPSREFIGLAQAVLEKGADFRLKAKGASMHPFICDGDIVTLGVAKGKSRVGDVVAAEKPDTGQFVIHRVVSRSCDKLLIKGDANPAPDGWIAEEKILGVVKGVQRGSSQVPPGSAILRRLIGFVSRQPWLQRVRFSIYNRLLYLGEVF